MDWSVCKFALIEFTPPDNICKRISFAISTFVIVEETKHLWIVFIPIIWFYLFFSLEFTIRNCVLTKNSENYNNKDLLSTYAYTHCVIFSRTNLELIWPRSDSKPLFKCSFEKRKGFCYGNLMFPSIKNCSNSSLKTSFPVLLSRKKIIQWLLLHHWLINIQACQGKEHGLRTPEVEIAFTERPKIHTHSQNFRNGQSMFCLTNWPKFPDFSDLCLHWVFVVRAKEYGLVVDRLSV